MVRLKKLLVTALSSCLLSSFFMYGMDPNQDESPTFPAHAALQTTDLTGKAPIEDNTYVHLPPNFQSPGPSAQTAQSEQKTISTLPPEDIIQRKQEPEGKQPLSLRAFVAAIRSIPPQLNQDQIAQELEQDLFMFKSFITPLMGNIVCGDRAEPLLEGNLPTQVPVFKSQPFEIIQNLGPDEHNIVSIGDIHGNAAALFAIFDKLIQLGLVDRNYAIRPDTTIIFTGDYVDRGPQDLETLTFLVKLANKNPDRVILLRGNHEDPFVNREYSIDPILGYEPVEHHALVLAIHQFYTLLAHAAYLGYENPLEHKSEYVFFVHAHIPSLSAKDSNFSGGSSSSSTGQISQIYDHVAFVKNATYTPPAALLPSKKSTRIYHKITETLTHPNEPDHVSELLWSDLNPKDDPMSERSHRGQGALISRYDVEKFLNLFTQNPVALIMHGHKHDPTLQQEANRIISSIVSVDPRKYNLEAIFNIINLKNRSVHTFGAYGPTYAFNQKFRKWDPSQNRLVYENQPPSQAPFTNAHLVPTFVIPRAEEGLLFAQGGLFLPLPPLQQPSPSAPLPTIAPPQPVAPLYTELTSFDPSAPTPILRPLNSPSPISLGSYAIPAPASQSFYTVQPLAVPYESTRQTKSGTLTLAQRSQEGKDLVPSQSRLTQPPQIASPDTPLVQNGNISTPVPKLSPINSYGEVATASEEGTFSSFFEKNTPKTAPAATPSKKK